MVDTWAENPLHSVPSSGLGGRLAVKNSRVPKTAVCVLRVEQRCPDRVLITVTTSPDVENVPRGEVLSVASCDQAIRLVTSFLRQCTCAGQQTEDP